MFCSPADYVYEPIMVVMVIIINYHNHKTHLAGVNPGAGKGRNTNSLSCRWVERTQILLLVNVALVFKQDIITS